MAPPRTTGARSKVSFKGLFAGPRFITSELRFPGGAKGIRSPTNFCGNTLRARTEVSLVVTRRPANSGYASACLGGATVSVAP
jgi:hypothetical protein